jgi:hypothetical protein
LPATACDKLLDKRRHGRGAAVAVNFNLLVRTPADDNFFAIRLANSPEGNSLERQISKTPPTCRLEQRLDYCERVGSIN